MIKEILRRAAEPCHFWIVTGGILDRLQGDKLTGTGDSERRVKRRFPIEQGVRDKMLYGQRIAETGSGKTMNISSGGIWFSTQTMLASGMPIELSLTGPCCSTIPAP